MDEIDELLENKEKTVSNDGNNLYLKRIQDKLKKAIESGMLNPEQQYGLIETTIDDLLSQTPTVINEDAVLQHDKELQVQMKILEDAQQKISDDYKKIYDYILGL